MKVEAAILALPFMLYAEDFGLTKLGSQAAVVVGAWPRSFPFAKEKFLAEFRITIRAFLWADVESIRLAQANSEAGVQTLMARLKYGRRWKRRARMGRR